PVEHDVGAILDVEQESLVAVEPAAVVAAEAAIAPEKELPVAVEIVTPGVVGVDDQRLARQSEVVMPEVEPRDDVLPDPGQEAARREELRHRVSGRRDEEPAAVLAGNEDAVVLVAE